MNNETKSKKDLDLHLQDEVITTVHQTIVKLQEIESQFGNIPVYLEGNGCELCKSIIVHEQNCDKVDSNEKNTTPICYIGYGLKKDCC